jgi:hypothetical protein
MVPTERRANRNHQRRSLAFEQKHKVYVTNRRRRRIDIIINDGLLLSSKSTKMGCFFTKALHPISMPESASTHESAISAAVDGGYTEDAILESFSVEMELRRTAPESERQFKGEGRSADKVMDTTRRFKEIAGFPGGTDDDEEIRP